MLKVNFCIKYFQLPLQNRVAKFHTNALYGHRCYHEIIFFEENFLNLVISCNEKKIKFVGLKLTQLEILQNPEMQII